MLLLGHVLAQTGGGGTGLGVNVGDILKFGITPVLVIVLIVTGVFRVGTFVDKEKDALAALAADRLAAEKDRADRAETRAAAAEERERKLRETAAEIAPAFQQTSNTLERVLDYMLRTGGPPPFVPAAPNQGGQG